MSNSTFVLYHGDADGFGSAWAAHRFLGDDPDVLYIATHYGQPPPAEIWGGIARLFILDFSYDQETMKKLSYKSEKMVCIDHHATSRDELGDIIDELNNVRKIELPHGEFCYVDSEDFDRLSEYSWSKSKNGGSAAYIGGGRKNPKTLYMNRFIMGDPEGFLVDHRNRNTLDNRKSNLRLATRQQNSANMRRNIGFKGVTKRGERWMAQITINYKNNYLGTFSTPEEAAAAYDNAARENFGEFALCNYGENLFPISANTEIIIDPSKSGAVLTWEHFHPGSPVPELLRYVQDRDLWQWKLADSRIFNLAISSYARDFATWDWLAETLDSNGIGKQILWTEGETLSRFQSRIVDSLASKAQPSSVGGHLVPTVNSPLFQSELGDALCSRNPAAPFSATYYVEEGTGDRIYSLRSRNGFDVSAIAKALGGGGHRAAAGFRQPRSTT